MRSKLISLDTKKEALPSGQASLRISITFSQAWSQDSKHDDPI